MSKQEWKKKFETEVETHTKLNLLNPQDQEGVNEVFDFFYSLHLDHIKAIREMIIKLDSKIQNDFLTEAILENPLLTIAE